MLDITNAAQIHFAKLLANQKPDTQIRVFVINPGTLHAECGVSYCPIDTVKANDIQLKFDLISAYIDELSFPYLQDAKIDLIEDQLGSQLTLKAPNAARVCEVSHDSPLIERVNYVIQSSINPRLAGHGGQVTVMEITDDMLVILQFRGGCNGCSMVNFTLKEGIERELMKKFPEIKGVMDLTEHQRGKHSYY